MPREPAPFSVRVQSGSQLLSVGSPDNVGAANYTQKTNFRRLDDAEVRREGTLLFRPNTGIAQGVQATPAGTTALVGVWEALRPNGDRLLIALTATDVYSFTYSSGTWAHLGGPYTSCLDWQAVLMDGYLVFNNRVDLPFYVRVENGTTIPLYEMRDIGIASVGTMCAYNGFLLCADVTEIASTQLVAFMNGSTPYTTVPDPSICNRIRYKIVWPDYNQLTNWSPLIKGTIQAAHPDRVILDYPLPHAFPVGSLLGVTGAGPNGGILGGQVGIDLGVPVTSVSGATLTLGTPADAGNVFPIAVTVQRFADTSTFAGSSSIQDDSSAVVVMKPLRNFLVVYRETGIFIGRYTASVETPFIFTPSYNANKGNVPFYPRAVVDVDGLYHLYPAKKRFYYFDGLSAPRIHVPTDTARNQFYADLTPSAFATVFAVHNPVTKEIWFNSPNGVLAYDYIVKTTSWIDESYSGAAYVLQPGGSEYWFVMTKGANLIQYAALEDAPPLQRAITFFRLGAPVVSSIKYGVTSLGDDENQKQLVGYMPLLAGSQPDVTLRIIITGSDNVAQAYDTLMDYTLTTSATDPMIPTDFMNVYFRDEIQVTDTRDIDCVFVGRNFRMNRVATLGATRTANGNS